VISKAFFVLLVALFTVGAASAAPRVVASIGPIHSLVAGVMEGVGAPDLLISNAASPHDQALRPSQARLLQNAALIVWVGPLLEPFLAKPVLSLGGDARRITLMESPGIMLLPMRAAMGASAAASRAQPFNPHIWLGPKNAIAIAASIAAALGEIDPDNANTYQRNAAAMARRIDALAAEIEITVAAVKSRPYVVLHDAFSYFEARFSMDVVGAIMASPDQKPSAKRLLEIRRRIVAQRIVCVFDEPQISGALLRSVVANTPARTGILDPLGVGLRAGPDAYFGLMRAIANALVDCLGR
jgi:zinc transport system substrate-binding protein